MRKLFLFLMIFGNITPLYGTEISFYGGGSDGGKLKFDLETLNLKNAGVLGVRFEKDFAEVLGFENNLAYTRNVLTAEGESGQSGFYYAGNLVLNIPIDQIVPNFSIGLGFVYRTGDSLPQVGTSFLANFGGGIKIREIAGPVGIRFDYRRFQYFGIEGEGVGTNELTGGVLITF